MKKGSSPFRFVTSDKPGRYSVWRGESEQIGYLKKVTHHIAGKTIHAGWLPTTYRRGIELPIEKTQEAAARALWLFHQAQV